MIGNSQQQQCAAFQLRPGTDPSKLRIESLNVAGGILACGEHKGGVALSQIFASETDFRLHQLANASVSKKPIVKIEILKETKHVVALTNDALLVLEPGSLAVKKTLGKSVTTFAVSPSDWIASASGKKIAFFSYKAAQNEFTYLTFGKHYEFSVPDSVSSLVWNGGVIGAALKKNYIILAPESGTVTELAMTGGILHPRILVFHDYWVAITADSVHSFDLAGKVVPGSAINIQATSKPNPIVAMDIKDHYLIVLRETTVGIFNLIDYTKAQDIELEKGDVGKALAVDRDRVLLGVGVAAGSKKDALGKIVCLREVPAEEQIKKLLFQSRVADAYKVFCQNNPATDPDFSNRREQFNIEAGWALLLIFEFDKAVELLSSGVNFDPREFLALVPDILPPLGTPYKTLKDLVAQRQMDRGEFVVKEGTKAVARLLEFKRQDLAGKFDLAKDGKRPISFVYPALPVNNLFRGMKITLEQMMELIDNSLMKLYVAIGDIKLIQIYFESAKMLKCNYKEMEQYLKDRVDRDKSAPSIVCLAYLYDKFGNYLQSLALWRSLGGQGLSETRELACRETMRLLMTQSVEKQSLLEYAKMVLILHPAEGLKIFTENPSLPKFITEEDVIAYLDKELKSYQSQLKEQYLEFLVRKPVTEERFHTLLALHYIQCIKEIIDRVKMRTVELVVDPTMSEYRRKFNKFLDDSKSYNAEAVLEAMNSMGMFEEEIKLYSKQGKHVEALKSLVGLGKQSVDFSKAEDYCLAQDVPLLDELFENLMKLCSDARKRRDELELKKAELAANPKTSNDLKELRDYVDKFELYCRNYLKKYATHDKMNAEKVLTMIPEEWGLREVKSGNEDDSLYQYLSLTLDDRLEKENNTKVGKSAAEMYKLNVETDLIKLQRAYVVISPERKCKVCLKPLAGAKSFYVFPNGVVTHSNCVKDINVCPVTNVNFAKKVFQ